MDQRLGIDDAPHGRKRPSSLAAALRAARADGAERAQAMGELRDAELARLDLLREMLDPVLAEVPPEVDLFDTGVVPGQHPRLFVDMITFVEMGHDRRSYRLLQDRRDGRVLLAETEGVGAMVTAVTGYIARRLVERESLLASLDREPMPPIVERRAEPVAAPSPEKGPAVATALLRLVLDALGVLALAALLWIAWRAAHGAALPAWWTETGLPRP